MPRVMANLFPCGTWKYSDRAAGKLPQQKLQGKTKKACLCSTQIAGPFGSQNVFS